ncbi:MAG: STAS domain-containing protein [Gallionella sp.]|nr:STAS domain-containing protein [Gallionella sp.]
MTIHTQLQGDKARIKVSDRFDSGLYQEFKSAYTPLLDDKALQTIEIDISQVNYLDSGALGMLVLLNECAKNAKKTILLISIPGPVADVLKIANADKLFAINLPSGVKLDLHKQ